MTNKEAIEERKEIRATACEISIYREYVEALDHAIKALGTIDKIKFNVYALNELLQEAENECS